MTPHSDTLVLIVDDEEMNLIVLSKILGRAGFEIATAENGLEAVERMKSEPPPKIVLMDLMMPVMSGWDATKIIKEDPTTGHIPIIAVTALSREREAALKFGFDGFCPKPIDFTALVELIHSYLDKKAS